MLVIRQAILFILVGAAFALLLKTYRKQNAIEESFLCGILLMVAGCVEPDALLFFPVVWWAFTVLWADSLRVYLASVCAILLVAFYVALLWLVLPDSAVSIFVRQSLTNAFSRSFCYSPEQLRPSLTGLSVAAVTAFIGLWTIFAHLARYTRANARVQNFFLITLPVFLLSLLSVLFPMADGNSLLSVLIGSTLFLIGLYLQAYGLPRIRLPKKRRDSPNKRKWRQHKNPYRM